MNKNHRRVLYISLVCLFWGSFLFLFGCSKKQATNSFSLNIVASTFPCYDAVRAVLGENIGKSVGLNLLVKPGAEVHSFDPSPSDVILLQKSDVFIFVGGESDEWVRRLIKSNKGEGKTTFLCLMDYVNVLEEYDFDENKINPNEIDEHIWTSPENELKILDTVCSALCEVAKNKGCSELCESFIENKNNYSRLVENVSASINQIVEAANEKYIVMADRFPLAYFANYYGLGFYAAFNGCSTAVEASAQKISRLVDCVQEKKLPAIFYMELSNHKIADAVAEICGVDALLLQSCQNVTKTDFDNGETWVSLMTKNADALKKGLR